MSKSKTGDDVDLMEGWSYVRYKDDVGSDADSVEVISDDSDRDTCNEGKEAGDDDPQADIADSTMAEIADSTTKESTTSTSEEMEDDGGDLGADLLRLDPLGDFVQRWSDRLHGFLLTPRYVPNDRASQELKLHYVIFASTLLALICSLLASSYLLFNKIQGFPEKRDDSASMQVLQELEQAISKLQTVLHVENEQHVKDVLSRIPPDYLSVDKIISNDRINRRKTLRRSQALPTMKEENHDFGVITSIETNEITSNGHNEDVKENEAPQDRKPTVMNLGTDQAKTNPPTGNKPKPFIDLPLNPDSSVDDLQNPSKDETHNPDIPPPSLELKPQHEKNYFETQDHSQKDSKLSDSDDTAVLLDVRKDLLSIQNQLYSQIMNSLFEYKIDLYKNLMRAGLDSTCNVDHSSKKSNHKKFMMIRNLQNMIAKSSESNFESWYKFYSYSVSPQFRTIVSKLDSITKKNKEKPTKEPLRARVSLHLKQPVLDKEKLQGSVTSDDFFVRSTVPFGGSDYQIVHSRVADGFDWKNLNKRIRDMKKARNEVKEGLGQKFNAEDKEEKAQSSTMPSSGGQNYNTNKESHLFESDKVPNLDEVAEHKVFEKVSSIFPEESLNKDGRKKSSVENIDEKPEQLRHKQGKSTKKHDSTCEEERVKNQGNKKTFEKHNDGKKGRNPGDKEKEKVKPEQRDRMNGGHKEHFGKEYCPGGKCDKKSGKDYYFHEGKPRKKTFLNNMTKYVKKAASGLWTTVRGGFKKVKNYGSYIKDWHTREDKGKGNYEEWRKEFVKEMKDVIKVLGVNPAINGLYEFPKSVTRFFGDGLGKLMNSVEWDEEVDLEGASKGPDGVKLEECNTADGEEKMGSHGTCSPDDSEDVTMDDSDSEGEEEVDRASWYTEAARHRAKSRGDNYPGEVRRSSDPSWFLGLGRHRSYLRRRGIHLDDDGSWFISSARHRAKMRLRHTDPKHFAQASSKR
ncbi:hypothetical protein GE061_001764 [Apolygus lucorum]|uniref:Uncharacterized protein n=1 Tax=Apolygus lucorum TaxID=248454 RepID=A0A8S9X3A5_APOLU|nr:hypothetical protein GE061_001764 [Apolygus lucorum]